MLVYQARLEAEAMLPVSITVLPGHSPRSLSTGGRPERIRLVVHYAAASGAIRRHAGSVSSMPTPHGWIVAGYQLQASDLTVSLAPASPGPPAPEQLTAADSFTLPVCLVSWGVTTLSGVDLKVQAVGRSQGEGLAVRGAVWLSLQTPGAPLRTRIPFYRLRAGSMQSGVRWQVLAGVTGLRLKVEPGGRISGELTVTLRCLGAPARPAEPEPPPLPALVKELSGAVRRVKATPLADGTALAQGALELDLYWVDREGASRWTGRTLPFSTMMEPPGLAPGDRLEPSARVERLAPVTSGGQVTARGAVSVNVTALRPALARREGRLYRLDEVVGTAEGTVVVEEVLLGGSKPPLPSAPQAMTSGLDLPEAVLPAPELNVVLGPVAIQPGHWSLPAFVGSGSAGRVRGWLPGLGGGEPASAGLVRLSGQRLEVRMAVAALPAVSGDPSVPQEASAALVREIDLPGPVRSILGLSLSGDQTLTVEALLAMAGGGLRRVVGAAAPLPDGSPLPGRLTATPVLAGDLWRLRLLLG